MNLCLLDSFIFTEAGLKRRVTLKGYSDSSTVVSMVCNLGTRGPGRRVPFPQGVGLGKAMRLTEFYTTRSAVAERPRDASCLSVASFNSTVPRAQSVIIRLQIYQCVQLNYVLLSSA